MAIVSSTLHRDAHTQANGTRYIFEQHTDSTGRAHTIGPYTVDASESEATSEARMNARVARIEAALAEAEVDQVIDGS